MKKKEFQNLPNTDTPITAETLNEMQENIEESAVIVSSTEPTTNEKVWFKTVENLFVNEGVLNNSNIYANGEIKSDTMFKLYYIPCEANTEYLIEAGYEAVNSLILSSSAEVPQIGLIASGRIVTCGSYKYTTGANDKYLIIRDDLENVIKTSGLRIFKGGTAEAIYIKNSSGVYEKFYENNRGEIVAIKAQLNELKA